MYQLNEYMLVVPLAGFLAPLMTILMLDDGSEGEDRQIAGGGSFAYSPSDLGLLASIAERITPPAAGVPCDLAVP